MLDLFRLLKLEYKDYVILFKSGSFYCSFDEDAVVINKIFNYKINELKNHIKVGFPISLIEKNTEILKTKKVSYIIVENKKIVKTKKIKNNHYSKYIDSVFNIISLNNRINRICSQLKLLNGENNIEQLLTKIEEILYE